MGIRTVIVDDEKLARDRVRGFLQRVEDVEVVGEAGDGPEAVRVIDECRPDLVLLDVQMPGSDGFAVLRQIRCRPHVVFTTAWDEYAVRAFEVRAVDYLLKPISRRRLEEAVARVRESLQGPRAEDADYGALLQALENARRRYPERIPAQRGRRIVLLPVDDIRRFEVEFRLVYAYTESERFMTGFTLSQLEERLDPEQFFRAHKSRLVNLRHVKAIVPISGGRFHLVLDDSENTQVELSRAQARVLRRRMEW